VDTRAASVAAVALDTQAVAAPSGIVATVVARTCPWVLDRTKVAEVGTLAVEVGLASSHANTLVHYGQPPNVEKPVVSEGGRNERRREAYDLACEGAFFAMHGDTAIERESAVMVWPAAELALLAAEVLAVRSRLRPHVSRRRSVTPHRRRP